MADNFALRRRPRYVCGTDRGGRTELTIRRRVSATRACRPQTAPLELPQVPRQHHGLVVFLVLCGVHEGDGVVGGDERPQLLRRGVVIQLGAVLRSEFREPLGIVPEPLAQIVARPDLPQPQVHGSVRLGDASRPQPIDENPVAVAGIRSLVHALDAHIHASIVALAA